MSDSSAIDAALVGMLLADTGSPDGLMTLLPDGVFFDQAAPNAKRFVLISLVDEVDEATFEGRAIENALYLVKAVALSTSGVNMAAAAARIDALLDGQPLRALSPPGEVPGYAAMAMYREARVRATEVDDLDPSIRWHHRGGQYRVQMSLGSEP